MSARDTFAARVVRWQRAHGRHDLPWQTSSPYEVWLSEVMLQQTQVATVIPYYEKFLRRFPDVATLAAARAGSVLACWSGLGYYARARHLHQAAKAIARDGFPNTVDGWRALPGVGASSAAAIMVFAYGERAAILDGNVKRILARVHAVDVPIDKASDNLWRIAGDALPSGRTIRPYTQGLMDLGSKICVRKNPQCDRCPLQSLCLAHRQGQVEKYPVAKKKKIKPRKTTHMLLVRHEDRILLEKRAARGIWGGLWSLPEEGRAAGAAQLGCRLRVIGGHTFAHSFTHYDLSAHVVECRCLDEPAQHHRWRWFTMEQLARKGLPAPIRRLLADIHRAR